MSLKELLCNHNKNRLNYGNLIHQHSIYQTMLITHNLSKGCNQTI
jgi:hypothetical protein